MGSYKGKQVGLSLELIEEEQFYIVHYLISSNYFWNENHFDAESSDWDLTRYSGFMAVNSFNIIHLRHSIYDAEAMWFLGEDTERHINHVNVFTKDLANAVSNLIYREYIYERQLPFIDPKEYCIRLERSDSQVFKDLVAKFRWRVPL